MGPNGMHSRVLKELPDVLSRPLRIIFSMIWEYGEVSVNWKPANIGSIFKKGKKEESSIITGLSVSL